MRIMLVCNKYPFPPRDGGSLATFNMLKGLVEAGNVVDLLAMNTSKHYIAGNKSDGIPGLNIVRKVFVNNAVTISGLAYNFLFSSLPYNAARIKNKLFRQALAEMLNAADYDVVQLEGLYLALYAGLIKKHSKAGIIYRAHNVEHLIWQKHSNREKNLLKRWYLRSLCSRIRNFEQDFINVYDLLVPISGIDLELLNSMGNKKPSVVVPFGMYNDDDTTRINNTSEDYSLLYIGALDWMPNVDALVWFVKEVWLQVKRRYPELKFFVAGRNAAAGLEKYLLQNGVYFLGEVENTGDFLSKKGIVVVPLFSGSGIRVKIIEAMFAGKPVIATSVSAKGISVENEKHILLADDAGEFIACIGKLLADKKYAFRMGMNGRELSQQIYDNRVITKELTAFYKHHLI